VFDTKPHKIDDHQQLVLNILSNQVMKILELREGMELLNKKQQELEEQKEINNDANIRLRSFFESSTNFQILLGKNGEVIDFNKTAFNFIKTVHKCVLKRGDQFIQYLHPEFVATFIDRYNQTLEGKKSAVEGSTDYAELGVIWWEAAFETARDANNEIIGVSYLIRNVTERKLKEQKIISQNQSLLKIAHIQAHEFRAPLTTIMGLMNLIKEDEYSPPSEYLQFLEQAVDALDTTIRLIVSDIDNTVIHDYANELNS
jgi:PAS domain S-box-containing protein